MARILLATSSLWPDGEPEGHHLVSAFARRGHEAEWVRWDDAGVDWAAADVVAARSPWDYHRRWAEFLDWARRVEGATRLLNGAEVFEWNADKSYLVELAGWLDAAVVPTLPLDDSSLVPGVTEALDRWGTVVVKPRTGAGGLGVVVATGLDDPRLEGLTAAPWVVQPLVESVRTTGETSVYVFGGHAAAQFVKRTAGADGEVRVNEQYGGTVAAAPLGAEESALAEAAVRVSRERRSADLVYARVDLMAWDGRWVVSELELIEPGLYLDIDPGNADRFADLVAARL